MSPLATRQKKRSRGNPASSDGEVETRATQVKVLRSRTLKKPDVKGFSDEELDEIRDDPDADDEELEVEVQGVGSYRQRSLELDGWKGDSEDEDEEQEEDKEGDDDDDSGNDMDEEDLDPTYQAVDSGEDGEGEWGTSAGVWSTPSRPHSKGSYLRR